MNNMPLCDLVGKCDPKFELALVSTEAEQNFVKLIVRECAIVGAMEEPHQDISKLIKQHFGIE